jgi:CHAD domain-containing protein
VKAEPVELTAETTVEQALCRILRACLRHFFANEAIALAGDDPEGVHQMRVALRRLRSAIGLFRRFLPATLSDWIVDEVRWLGTALGPARDWDVFLAELLAPVRMALDEADLQALEAVVQARRDHAACAVRDVIGSPRLTLFQLKLGEALEARDWAGQLAEADAARLSQPVESLAGELLARRHRKVRQAGNDFAALSADERHRLRIALKKLRYAAEFFRSLYDDKAVRRTIQHVSVLQDTLGHFNDVATATRLLHSLHEAEGEEAAAADTPAVARGAGMVIGWHARGTSDMHEGLAGRWDDFLALKPFWSKGRRSG